ncbi:hypothetical protein R2083_11055 [Nitrosomonas sp. Is35]|uniref:hypothetical protein n=1 Tax=Nitrosomonas sp. Is35 TaxID=3080534 RepID=UPI00294B5D02|nr:hypothetical protein [Nitrosomonas sp. Is35]MDV6348051.1 hypothetical protein [Nitrosomonas sp. Is35]
MSSRLIGAIGAIVTCVSVIDFSTNSFGSLGINFGLLLTIGIVTFFIVSDIKHELLDRKRFESNDPKIAVFLCEQLKKAGRVAIFSRDISWITSGSEAEKLLLQKANSKELVLFVQSITSIAQKLANEGAEVRTYQKFSGYKPKSRFTVLDYEKTGSRVLIGYSSNGEHLIDEFNDSNKAIVDLGPVNAI